MRFGPALLIPIAIPAITAGIAWGGAGTVVALATLGVGLLALVVWLAAGSMFALLPLLTLPPELGKVFAHEIGLVLVAIMVAIAGRRLRATWLTRLSPVEVAVIALWIWAGFTVFWSSSLWWWVFGMRKVGIGVLALWTATRLARLIPAERIKLGLTATAFSLSIYTLVAALRSGVLFATGWIDRKQGTSVGWGTSNYIAAILVLLLPTAIEVAMRHPRRAARIFAWVTVPFCVIVMSVAASRGGALLAMGIILVSLLGRTGQRRAVGLLIGLAGAAAAGLMIPGGTRLLSRFTDVRELGSVVVRLLLYREAWRRMVRAWPWGLGHGQGFVTADHLGVEDPHNYWLVIGGELGLVGLVLWLTATVVMWRAIRRIGETPGQTHACRTMTLTFLIAQVNCLFEPTFQGLHYHFLFYWILGSFLGAAEPRLARAAFTRLPISYPGKYPETT